MVTLGGWKRLSPRVLFFASKTWIVQGLGFGLQTNYLFVID